MGAAIINTYLLLLFLLVHFKIVRFNLFWKASPFIVLALIMFGLLIPMNGAPRRARQWSCAIPSPSCRA
jgi:uncharacterized SAM-binding protein YcdF (DUF218 family)